LWDKEDEQKILNFLTLFRDKAPIVGRPTHKMG